MPTLTPWRASGQDTEGRAAVSLPLFTPSRQPRQQQRFAPKLCQTHPKSLSLPPGDVKEQRAGKKQSPLRPRTTLRLVRPSKHGQITWPCVFPEATEERTPLENEYLAPGDGRAQGGNLAVTSIRTKGSLKSPHCPSNSAFLQGNSTQERHRFESRTCFATSGGAPSAPGPPSPGHSGQGHSLLETIDLVFSVWHCVQLDPSYVGGPKREGSTLYPANMVFCGSFSTDQNISGLDFSNSAASGRGDCGMKTL